jgi:hypothetical protein
MKQIIRLLFSLQARKRAGNPFHAEGKVSEKIVGELADIHVKRTDLRAIKIIGAGQFGKVYLAMQVAANDEG